MSSPELDLNAWGRTNLQNPGVEKYYIFPGQVIGTLLVLQVGSFSVYRFKPSNQ
jgi:hypothetical protein